MYEGGLRVPFAARWPGHIEARQPQRPDRANDGPVPHRPGGRRPTRRRPASTASASLPALRGAAIAGPAAGNSTSSAARAALPTAARRSRPCARRLEAPAGQPLSAAGTVQPQGRPARDDRPVGPAEAGLHFAPCRAAAPGTDRRRDAVAAAGEVKERVSGAAGRCPRLPPAFGAGGLGLPVKCAGSSNARITKRRSGLAPPGRDRRPVAARGVPPVAPRRDARGATPIYSWRNSSPTAGRAPRPSGWLRKHGGVPAEPVASGGRGRTY